MIKRIQSLPYVQRYFVFLLMVVGAIFILLALALLMTSQSFTAVSRIQGRPMIEDITVTEFATLPDDDAYPAAIALSSDGTLYTGSYASGALWQIDSSGKAVEIPASREQIGSVTGLAVGTDRTLYILDRLDPLTAQPAIIWRLPPDGTVAQFATLDEATGGYDDIELDSAGRLYVTDRVALTVWRFEADGTNPVVWWQPPDIGGANRAEPTGLAYDPANNAMLITDPTRETIYSVPVDAEDTASAASIVYDHANRPDSPGFDGLTVTPEGVIYVTARSQNRVARVDGDALVWLAESFRGASDLVYNPALDALYVTNWNQFGLLSNSSPQLPFALDVIALSPEGQAGEAVFSSRTYPHLGGGARAAGFYLLIKVEGAA